MTATVLHPVAAYWDRELAALREGLHLVGAGELAAVHRTRVATRRLRSTLRTFGRGVPAELTDGVEDELRDLALGLGAVRDRQVLRELLDQWPGVDDQARDVVCSRLDREIEAATPEVRGLARSARAASAVVRLTAIRGELADASTDDRRGTVALVQRRFLRAAAHPDDPHRLHATRKAVKRARYAAEVFVDDPDAQVDVVRFERLQEHLGHHQDLVLALEYVQSTAAEESRSAGPADESGMQAWMQTLQEAEATSAAECFWLGADSGVHALPAGPASDALEESA